MINPTKTDEVTYLLWLTGLAYSAQARQNEGQETEICAEIEEVLRRQRRQRLNLLPRSGRQFAVGGAA